MNEGDSEICQKSQSVCRLGSVVSVRRTSKANSDLLYILLVQNSYLESDMSVPVIVSRRSFTLIAAFVGLVAPGSTLS